VADLLVKGSMMFDHSKDIINDDLLIYAACRDQGVIVGQLESQGFDISRLDALIKLEFDFENQTKNLQDFEENPFKTLKDQMPRWQPWHLKFKKADQKEQYYERVELCRLVLQPWTTCWETFQEMKISQFGGLWWLSRQIGKCFGFGRYPYHSLRSQLGRAFSLWYETEEWSDFNKRANVALNMQLKVKMSTQKTEWPGVVKSVYCGKWGSAEIGLEEQPTTLYKVDIINEEQKNVQTGFTRECLLVTARRFSFLLFSFALSTASYDRENTIHRKQKNLAVAARLRRKDVVPSPRILGDNDQQGRASGDPVVPVSDCSPLFPSGFAHA
jgi:hypothetical protein